MLTEKMKSRPNYCYSAEYDKVTSEQNIALYDLYVNKLEKTVYAKRPNNPLKTLVDGRKSFLKLSVADQAKALLNIHSAFGRVSSGCDFTAVGGAAHAAATVNFSASVSNWKKNYKDISIIDASASGLWEKQSENLLDIL